MHDALVPHSPRDRSIRSAARAALQGILLCTLDYGPRSRVKIWRGKTAKDCETVRVRLLRSHQCRGRCGSLPGLCSGRCMRVARAALGAIEPLAQILMRRVVLLEAGARGPFTLRSHCRHSPYGLVRHRPRFDSVRSRTPVKNATRCDARRGP